MSTLTKSVTAADKNRKVLRDQKRSAFFSEHDLKVFSDPFAFDFDPKAQLSVALYLLEDMLEKHMDETSAIRDMKRQLESLSLGVSIEPTSKSGRPVRELMKPQCWQFGFFKGGAN